MGITRYTLDNDTVNPNNANQNNNDASPIFLPLHAAYSKYEHDWNSIIHTHPYLELLYINNGSGFFITEEKEYSITKGQLIIINANTPHTEKSSENMPLEYISVAIKDLCFSFNNLTSYAIYKCNEDQAIFSHYMHSIFTELKNKKPDYVKVCQNQLEILIIQLQRLTNYSIQIESTTRIARECNKIKQYIDFHFSQELSLEKLAALTHLNKYYVSHIFSKHFGYSPMQYLCQVRIQNSKNLLANTDFSITEIAQMSGFSSHSYFTQCFLKHCNISPHMYRKSISASKNGAV